MRYFRNRAINRKINTYRTMIDVIGSTLVSFKTRGWLEDVKWVILEQDRLKRAISRLERLLKK